MPRVVIHNQVVAYEVGQEYIQAWYDAEQGKLDPFVLIIEGSIGNEEINGDGHWTGFGVNPENGQPITTNEWVDRLANKAAAVVAIGTCATYGGIPAMKNNPTGAMGLPDYLGWKWKSKAGLPVVCIPGCPAQPDNMTETLLYLVLHLGGPGAGRPSSTTSCGRSGCSGARCARAATAPASTEQGNFATEYGDDHRCLVKLGCKGPVVQVQRAGPRLGERHRRLPERRRHLHGLHDARLPRQVHAVHGPGPVGQRAGQHGALHLRPGPAVLPRSQHQDDVRQGAGVAQARAPSSRPATRSAGEEASIMAPSRHPRTRRSSSRRCRGTRSPASSGQPRHPHRDRLHEPAGPQVLLDLDGLPRVRHLHEGDRPARRALHHEPDLRHLR